MSMNDIDDEWASFLVSQDTDASHENPIPYSKPLSETTKLLDEDVPISTDIYISTKSKIAYLNQMIDLQRIFWGINIIPYTQPIEGIIKKQMKFNSMKEEELELIQENLKKERYFDQQIITSIQK